jgi:hypothetical protein
MSATSKDAMKFYTDKQAVKGENKDIAADKTGSLQMKAGRAPMPTRKRAPARERSDRPHPSAMKPRRVIRAHRRFIERDRRACSLMSASPFSTLSAKTRLLILRRDEGYQIRHEA